MATIDTSGVDWVKHSVQRVLDSLNWKYLAEEDVGAREIVCIFGAGDLGNWVLINRILAPKGVLLIMATCQENVPSHQRQAAIEFVTRANFGILNGFFDMDLTDGDLRFSSRVEYGLMADAAQFEANFRQTFQIVHGTFSKYLPAVVGVTKKAMTGRQAVELIEGGANMLPNASQAPLLATVARHLSATSTNYVSHPEKGIIRMPCTIGGITYHLRVKAMEDTQHLYVFCNYPRTGGRIPAAYIADITEYITRANWALPFGYFDMDLDDGELRFVIWLPAHGVPALVIQTHFVRALIVSAITSFVKYLPGIDGILSGQQTSPEKAVEAVEAELNYELGSESIARIMDAGLASSDDEDQDAATRVRLNLAKHSPVADSIDFAATKGNAKENADENIKRRFRVKTLYNADGSGTGVLEFIGTRGRSSPWSNPVETGDVLVSSSSQGAGANGDITDIVGQNLSRIYTTSPGEQPWIVVDLRQCRLIPTHYRLCHHMLNDSDALRSWQLQASNDGRHWTMLDEQVGNRSLGAKSPKITLSIAQRLPPVSYGMFRLLMTGPNSSHRMQLAISNLELFGHLTVDFPVEPHLIDLSEDTNNNEGAVKPQLNVPNGDIDCDWLSSSHVGSGAHGDVFRGLYNGVAVALKRISYRYWTKDQVRHFRVALEEHVISLSSARAPELVYTLGLCDDDRQQAFIIVNQLVSTSSSLLLPPSTPMKSRLALAIQAATAVAALHERDLAHGSLHIGNILISYDNSNLFVSDAGLSSCLSPVLVGRPIQVDIGFTAPELIQSSVSTKPALVDKIGSDLYSLGMIIYVLTAGKLPFDDLTDISAPALLGKIAVGLRPSLPSSLPESLITLIKSLWDPAAAKRPDASTVVQTLNKITVR